MADYSRVSTNPHQDLLESFEMEGGEAPQKNNKVEIITEFTVSLKSSLSI
jgi:hypothetical protein